MSADLSSDQPLVGDASPENEQPTLVSDSKLVNDACESILTVAIASLTILCMSVFSCNLYAYHSIARLV